MTQDTIPRACWEELKVIISHFTGDLWTLEERELAMSILMEMAIIEKREKGE